VCGIGLRLLEAKGPLCSGGNCQEGACLLLLNRLRVIPSEFIPGGMGHASPSSVRAQDNPAEALRSPSRAWSSC